MSDVTLSVDECTDIVQMLQTMADNGTFRSRQSGTRSAKQQHWLVGFMAQRALARFLESEHDELETVAIDTRAYDDVSADSGDLWKYTTTDMETADQVRPVEVKKTASYANHVAVTRREARQIGSDEPIVYVTTNWEGKRGLDWSTGLPSPDAVSESSATIQFSIEGYCYLDDLTITEQGAKPWTQQADNYCQHFGEMRTDWAEFVDDRLPECDPNTQTTLTDLTFAP